MRCGISRLEKWPLLQYDNIIPSKFGKVVSSAAPRDAGPDDNKLCVFSQANYDPGGSAPALKCSLNFQGIWNNNFYAIELIQTY